LEIVREDYSPQGNAWDSFPNSHARSRAYRWGEDGLTLSRKRGRYVVTLQAKSNQHALHCMEIWGGNHAADTSISTPGLDLWVYSSPHEQAEDGGDVHYVALCGGGVITRFILADVSGHGALVADMARSLRDLMRRNINRKSQVRLVKDLNRQFTDLAKMQRFATAIVATYRTTGDRLTVCNAGHPRPFWLQAATGQWSVLRAPNDDGKGPLANMPLGIDGSVSFNEVEVALGRGDLVLFYTDALLEASNPEGRQLGEAGLLELVRSLDVGDATKVPKALLGRLEAYRAGKAPTDDLTFLLLHHHAGGSPRLTLGQKLDVYARVFGLKRV
jgi:phosphoserine phosphatase RsbU/P